jgi:hypothetical protein
MSSGSPTIRGVRGVERGSQHLRRGVHVGESLRIKPTQ